MKDFLNEDTQKWYADRGISDSKLIKLFSELPLHCIVLLEDVDAARIGCRDDSDTDQEDKSTSRVTLSSLLNVLNDEALIRPGRADKKVYFQLADKKISTQLFHMVFKQTADHKGSKHECGDKAIERLANNFTSKVPDQVFSPTEVLSFLLEQKNSPFSAVTSVEN
ncbi:unnamed protein product [Penicillium roqueforti FM164]|uniref:Genomic scaffold, ProqFM164S02 n=1 Tax=Penicillium roqueforti (strain FM164) TaxID=1365484 RepID=W6Q1L9_PENRF|nr:unnamed protein product [Penicillium roqueforti FM164]